MNGAPILSSNQLLNIQTQAFGASIRVESLLIGEEKPSLNKHNN